MTKPHEIGIPPEDVQVYSTFWDLAAKNRAKSFANTPGPEITSAVIREAMFEKQPKPRYQSWFIFSLFFLLSLIYLLFMRRYIVGPVTSTLSGYQAVNLIRLLPERLVDWMVAREFYKIRNEVPTEKTTQ